MTTLRERCIEAMTAAVWPDGKWSAEAETMLDALLPVLAAAIKPHRWDMDYPESAPDECRVYSGDTFYSGVLHSARVVRDLLPSVRPDSPGTAHTEPTTRSRTLLGLATRTLPPDAPNPPDGGQ